MFEKASRLKLRFECAAGSLSVEDLWDLPLTSNRGVSLDTIAIGLHGKMKTETVSFVRDEAADDPVLTLKFEIVKHIIAVRKEENRKALDAKVRADQKQKILGILARKEDEALEGRSADELRALLADL